MVISTISVEIVNNTAAGVAGNSLYGGYIDGCKGFYGLETGGIAAFRKIFHYNTSNPSEVSSNQVGVCSLTSSNTPEPNGQNKMSQLTVYPWGVPSYLDRSDEWDYSLSSVYSSLYTW